MRIDRALKNNKSVLLAYFRNRADEFLTEIKQKYAETRPENRAKAINRDLNETKSKLIATTLQQA